ncbi:MAG: hypothetical protein IIU39_07915 [Ruminococcus sp.]|nr:hypothetical protein [Ruminococcus sp.]
MKNTRKKMLLSSLAMLLVALVALGSATYAWFSVSKTVKADQMKVKAVAAAGLKISNTGANGTFENIVHFGQNSDSNAYSLKPVSWNGAVDSGYIPNGNVAEGGVASYDGTFKAAASAAPSVATSGVRMGENGYFAEYDVWVKSAAAVAHSVSAKVTIDGDNDAIARCQLVDVATPANTKIFADSASDYACVTAAGSTKVNYTATAQGTDKEVSSTLADETARQFKLIVWFDGEDAQCLDGAKEKTADITVEFTATDM